MARVARLAGALLAETGGAYYLVGHLKSPCDFAAAGFLRPAELDARAPHGVRLEVATAARLTAPWLTVAVEGDALVALLVARLLVARTGTVSERLWRLVMLPDPTDPTGHPTAELVGDQVEARWLGELPDPVWQIVRDAVLRCA